MSNWDGQGLPPAAQARMERGRAGGPPASLLGISGGAALEACGFSVVGEVMGCIVQHIGFQGYGGCGYYGMGYGAGGGYGGMGQPGGGSGSVFGNSPFGRGGAIGGMVGRPSVVTSGGGGGAFAGFAPYVDALYYGYDTAMVRMLTECRDLGGDGVVGVTLEARRLDETGNREFIAYGTAVRAQSAVRPANLFSTQLQGHDVAKLLHGGWVPVAICVGISLAIRHDDWATLQQASAWAGNTEVSGYSELVHHVRADARQQFTRRTAAFGAEGAITSSIQLDIWSIEPGEGHRDHVALSMLMGTAISKFHDGQTAPTRSLSILPLSDPPGRKP
jgi:uncharacterized protein YbjQ (UPF0145 family)